MIRLLEHRFRRPTLVAVFCAAVLIGTGLARVIAFEAVWIVPVLLVAVATFRRQSLAVLTTLLLLGVCVGGLQGTRYMQRLVAYEPLYDTKVVLIAKAAEDSSYGKKKQVKFDVKHARTADGRPVKLVGKIGVSGFGENVVFRGDTVLVSGKLRKGTGSHQAWMSFAQIQLVKRTDSPIEKVRREFGAGMQTALPEPMASFGMGLLIGQNTTLPETVYKDLLMVGLVHIIAVSGYNLTIIIRASWRLFGDRSKYQTTIFSIILIGTFLLLTGGSASIVRASIVSLLSLAAWYYGRNFKPVTLILLAAAITCLANPLFVWSDLGWYLSFLAFYGVMVLGPQVRYRLLPERLRDSTIVLIMLESICAEIMAMPLILYIFGETSVVSLLANMVIAAFVPLAMLLTVVAGIGGMFVAPLVGWIAWPATILLTYMLDMAHLLASIPHVFVEHWYISLAGMVLLYAVIVAFNVILYCRLRKNHGIITALREEHTLLRPSLSQAAQPN